MNQLFNSNILILIVLTILWSFLHSALISPIIIKTLKKKLESKFKYYRIVYNLFSFVSFAVVVLFEIEIRQATVFDWNGFLGLIRILLLILVFILFYFGAKQYSFLEFIGLNQLNNQKINLTISHSGELNTIGIHKIIRHPWYLGTLIIIWLRDLSFSTICLNAVFTAYIIIGAFLEEKKLKSEFGQAYLNYQKQVSMLIPLKGLLKLFEISNHKK